MIPFHYIIHIPSKTFSKIITNAIHTTTQTTNTNCENQQQTNYTKQNNGRYSD